MFKYIHHPASDQKIMEAKKDGYVILALMPEVIEHLVNELGRGSETSVDLETIEKNVWLREDLSEILENVRSK